MEYDANCYLFDLKQGGCLLDLGIYNISYLDDFFNDELSDLSLECRHHECGVDSYVNANILFNEKVGIVECAIDHKKERCVIFSGEKGKMILKPLHRPLNIKVIINNKTVIDEDIAYEYDDFYSEIKHFNSLIENHQLESDIMSLDSSVNCAKILSAIKEKM